MKGRKKFDFFKNILTKMVFLVAIFASSIFSQNLYEMPFVNDNGITKCRRVVVGFKNLVILTPAGIDTVNTAIYKIKNNSFESILNQLNDKYGNTKIIKRIPDAVWGDTVIVNKNTGKVVNTVDLSQSFSIDFPKPVPLDSIIEVFKKLLIVKYAEPPLVISPLSTTPNDTYFGSQWNLNIINAPKAWDITKGSSSIKAAVIDIAGINSFNMADHEDFQLPGGGNKFVYGGFSNNGSSHAREVAGVLGAVTNNGIGVASLGWNTSIGAFLVDTSGGREVENIPSKIDGAVRAGFKIINFSIGFLNQYGCPADIDGLGDVTDAISRAYDAGVIMVAASGNVSYQVAVMGLFHI